MEQLTASSDKEELQCPPVAIIILNWNAWQDSLECIESLLRQDYPDFTIFLCDNGSTDDSINAFAKWSQGSLCVLPVSREMREYSVPPDTKPSKLEEWRDSSGQELDACVYLIKTGDNLGFAAGNNAGIRAALAAGFDYLWILNADTVVDQNALKELVGRMTQDPRVGLCGSLLCYYDAPDVIQEVGGCAYYPLIGMARRLAADRPRREVQNWRALEKKIGYVSAASCLTSRAFVESVGEMSEDYFLYCEEIDWATRARGKFDPALAEKSVVYHKKGRSTGSKSIAEGRSDSSTYYLWRARRRFTQKYHKFGMPGLFALGILSAGSAVLSGSGDTARAVIRGLLNLRRG